MVRDVALEVVQLNVDELPLAMAVGVAENARLGMTAEPLEELGFGMPPPPQPASVKIPSKNASLA
jgi:hypothetical protein